MSITPRIKSLFASGATIVLATLFTVGVVVAATTIGANLYSTGGSLFDKASTTAFQVQNGSGTQVLNVDTSNLGMKVTGAATTTIYHWLGTGGTANNLGYTGGELYVQDDVEIDGVAYMNRATSTSATSTAYLYLGPDFTEPGTFNFSGGDLAVAGDMVLSGIATLSSNVYSTGGSLFDKASTTAFQVQNGSGTQVLNVDTSNLGLKVTGAATSTLYIWAGAGGTANFVNYTGGDLYVQDDAEIDDKLFVTGNLTLAADLYSSDGILLNVASSTALEVQNGSGTSILKVDTSGSPAGVTITGNATATSEFVVGTTSWADATNTLTVVGTAYTTGRATTSGDFVVSSEVNAATTSIKIKADSAGGNGSSCLEMVDVEGTIRRIFVNGAGALTVASGACN